MKKINGKLLLELMKEYESGSKKGTNYQMSNSLNNNRINLEAFGNRDTELLINYQFGYFSFEELDKNLNKIINRSIKAREEEYQRQVLDQKWYKEWLNVYRRKI